MSKIEGTEGWYKCPACRSSQIEGGTVTVEDTQAWQQVYCLDCDAEWTEVYEASHREVKS